MLCGPKEERSCLGRREEGKREGGGEREERKRWEREGGGGRERVGGEREGESGGECGGGEGEKESPRRPIYTSPHVHPHTTSSPSKHRASGGGKAPPPSSLHVPASLCFDATCCTGTRSFNHWSVGGRGEWKRFT